MTKSKAYAKKAGKKAANGFMKAVKKINGMKRKPAKLKKRGIICKK